MVASVYSSQYLQTLQLSAAQAGRVTNVAVVHFMPFGDTAADVFYKTPEISFGPTGYGDALPPPKSSHDLLQEQKAKIMDPVREELEKATKALRAAWRDAVARGEIAADPDAEIPQILTLAKKEGALPEAVQDMVRLHAEARESFLTLLASEDRLTSEGIMRGLAERQRLYDGLVKQAIINLVDAQLAAEVTRGSGGSGGGGGDKAGLGRAETALQLIRLVRGIEGGDIDQRQEALASIRAQSELAALNTRRNEMISDIWRKVENHEIVYSIGFASAWGDPDVLVEDVPGMSSTFITKGYHMAAASLSMSTSGQLLETRV